MWFRIGLRFGDGLVATVCEKQHKGGNPKQPEEHQSPAAGEWHKKGSGEDGDENADCEQRNVPGSDDAGSATACRTLVKTIQVRRKDTSEANALLTVRTVAHRCDLKETLCVA